MKINKPISLLLFIGLFFFFMETEDNLLHKAQQVSISYLSADSIQFTGNSLINYLKKIPLSDQFADQKFLSFQN